MLVIKLEKWPEGDGQSPYPVGEIRILQTGGDCFVGDFEVEIDKAARTARMPGVWRTGVVTHFDHDELGSYDLLLRALIACLGGRSHAAVGAISPARSIFHQSDCDHEPA